MKKILILGSAGMLGHIVNLYFTKFCDYKVVNSSFPTKVNDTSKLLNVTIKSELENFIRQEKPDIVINCIGILMKASNDDPGNAIYINSYLPHQLTGILRETGGKLIHVSTDCVFSGKLGNYSEDDLCDAEDIYGKSKSLGEIHNNFDLTIRTSIIGPEIKFEGKGLFHWLMTQNGTINGYTNCLWGGVTTLELAKVMHYAIEQNITGLVHVTNGNKISKFELLKIIQNKFKKTNLNIIPLGDKIVDKSLRTIRNDFKYKIPPYSAMINDLYNFMYSNQNTYSKFYTFL